MSYDLYLLKESEVRDDPEAAFERLDYDANRTPTPDEEAQLRRLAADLQAASPGLDLTELVEGSFLLQLGYESERPVVIDITATEITMRWSYGAEDSAPALSEVATYLPVFERHGYVAYDPQLEQLFDADRDTASAAQVHRDVRARLSERFKENEPSRRLWKRLFGG